MANKHKKKSIIARLQREINNSAFSLTPSKPATDYQSEYDMAIVRAMQEAQIEAFGIANPKEKP